MAANPPAEAPPPAAPPPAAPPPAAPAPAATQPAAATPPASPAPDTTTTPPADPGWRWEVDTADAVKFELPNSWERGADGRVLVTRAPDKSVAMKFDAVAGGAKEAKRDEKSLLGYIGKHLTHAALDGGVRDVSHHGFSGVTFEGHGFEKGAKVRWMSEVLSDGKGHRLLILAIATQDGLDTHKTEIQKIFASIQPA